MKIKEEFKYLGNKDKMKLEVGKYYKTYGGWKAIVIWKISEWTNTDYYVLVIHKPKTEQESEVILHTPEGRAISQSTIGEPPHYGEHLPSDLKEKWKE